MEKNRGISSIQLPCCIEASEDYIPKAQYALQMLLGPLGISPEWCTKSELVDTGIYYGPAIDDLPQKVVCIPLHTPTLDYFGGRSPYDASSVRWKMLDNDRYPILFSDTSSQNEDLIASAFFWLSGWQEYTISNRDRHGRFAFASSLQAALDTPCEPVVDVYREVLRRQLLQNSVPAAYRDWNGKAWAFCPTHDIDYLRKWRPGMVYREIVEYFLANHQKTSLGARAKRLATFFQDALTPGDVFRKAFIRMIDEVEKRGGKATYFIKAGAHGPHDVYYNPRHSFLLQTLNRLKALAFEVGLHPSYYAHTHPGYLVAEKQALEEVWGSSVRAIRQHYLRYETPQTPRLQEHAGFHVDTSLAFADHEGFRNGTCHPFLRFDIARNAAGSSWEMPLCFMDGTLFNYRSLSTAEAIAVSEQLLLTCKRYHGICVGLWHNTLWDEMDFAGWGDHFLQVMDLVLKENGQVDTLSNMLATRL